MFSADATLAQPMEKTEKNGPRRERCGDSACARTHHSREASLARRGRPGTRHGAPGKQRQRDERVQIGRQATEDRGILGDEPQHGAAADQQPDRPAQWSDGGPPEARRAGDQPELDEEVKSPAHGAREGASPRSEPRQPLGLGGLGHEARHRRPGVGVPAVPELASQQALGDGPDDQHHAESAAGEAGEVGGESAVAHDEPRTGRDVEERGTGPAEEDRTGGS